MKLSDLRAKMKQKPEAPPKPLPFFSVSAIRAANIAKARAATAERRRAESLALAEKRRKR